MTAAFRFAIVNGPNLNRLGSREPELYGHETLADVEARLRAVVRGWPQCDLEFFQSNSEGALVDHLQARAPHVSGFVVNPGGLAHTSVVLRDAVAATARPAIEVHVTNIHARESFRRRSLLAGVCTGTVTGLGTFGYEVALVALARATGVPDAALPLPRPPSV